MDAEGFKERLKMAIGDTSRREYAKRAGLTDTAIRNYLSGESSPGLDKISGLAAAAGVRPDWLAFGFEPMKAGERFGGQVGSGPTSEYMLVPRYDIEASAGLGGPIPSDQLLDFIAFKTEWIQQELRVHPNKLAVIRARGDSMEPTIRDGDLLLIDLSTPGGHDDAIYAIQMGGNLVIKRIQYLLDGTILIISDNPKYREQVIKPGDPPEPGRVVGRVVWSGSRL